MADVIETLDIKAFLHYIISSLFCLWNKVSMLLPQKNSVEKHRYALTTWDIKLPGERRCPFYFVNENPVTIESNGVLYNIKVITVLVSRTETVLSSDKLSSNSNGNTTTNKTAYKSHRYNDVDIAEDFRKLSEREYCDQCFKEDLAMEKYVQTEFNEEKPIHRRNKTSKILFCKKCHKRLSPRQDSAANLHCDKDAIILSRNNIAYDVNGNICVSMENICTALWKPGALYPEMNHPECRKVSFDTNLHQWYYMQFNSNWKINAYVDAGYFLTSDGYLKCYICGMCIRHNIQDEPFKFHQECSPRCIELLNTGSTHSKFTDTPDSLVSASQNEVYLK